MVWICSPGQILVFLVETGQFEDQDIWHIPQLFCWSDRFCLRQHLVQDLKFENNAAPKMNLFKSSIEEMLPPPLPSRRKICMFSKQWTTVHGSVRLNISYAVYIHYGGNSASLTCSMEANNLHVCLNLLLSKDTSSLKIVSHLPGRPSYVISLIQDMRHKQDTH